MHHTSYFPKRCAYNIWEEEKKEQSRGEEDLGDKVEKRSRLKG